jgi:alpha-glucosidase
MRFWLDRGVDGFRIDVAHRMARDPELRDNPLVELGEGEQELTGLELAKRWAGQQRHDEDWPEVHEILRGFRRTLDAYADRIAVGEVYLLDLQALARYYGRADELHLVHNFVFVHQPWKAEAFHAIVDEFWSLLPEGAWPAWFLGNHDHPRVASRYDDGGNGPARARVAAMMVLTLRGTPFLYQGEELGMTDSEVPPELVVDVDGRDPERTPMQWDGSPTAGFTTGIPWLPVPDSAREVNVAAERDDPRSMLSFYRRLLWYRKGSAALRGGDYRSLDDAPDGCYAYLRSEGDERLLVALNFTGQPLAYRAGAAGGGGRLELTTDPDRRTGGPVGLDPLELGPGEGVVVRLP